MFIRAFVVAVSLAFCHGAPSLEVVRRGTTFVSGMSATGYAQLIQDLKVFGAMNETILRDLMTPNAIPTASSWPKPKGTQMLSAAKQVSGSFDGGLKLWDRSPGTCKSQKEGGDKEALFIIANGGTLSNVIVGSAQGEGIHCMGSCTLKNIWWEDVCEDAATFKQGSGTSFIIGGGAKKASDKVMQHNGGGTVHIKDYYADDVGKLYRSCGNCENNKKGRSVIVENSHVSNIKACAVGVNGNFGVKNSCIKGTVCNLFKGVVGHNQGKPSKTASEPDGKACVTQAVTSDC